jgi:hypothetical protein
MHRRQRLRLSQASGHIPVTQHHSERRIALAAHRRNHIFEALGIEFPEKPGSRLPQHRLAPEIKQLEI